MIIAVLLSATIYFGGASLYNYVIIGIFMYYIIKTKTQSAVIKLVKNNIFLKFMFVWLLYAVVSIIWANDRGLAFRYIYNIFLEFSLVVSMVLLLDSTEKLKKIFNFMVITVFIVCILCLIEATLDWHFMFELRGIYFNSYKLTNVPLFTFGNQNDLSLFLLELLPVNLILSLKKSNKKISTIAFLNIFMSLLVFSYASSRTCIIMFLIVVFIFLYKVLIKKPIIFLGIALLTFVISFVLFMQFPDYVDKILSETTTATFDVADKAVVTDVTSADIRIKLILNGLRMFINSAGFGVGAGNHRALMGSYSFKYNFIAHIRVMHNFLVELLADYGAFIFFFFLSAFIKTTNKSKKCLITMYGEDFQQYSSIFSFSFILIFLIGTITTSSTLQLPAIWIPLGIIAAMVNVFNNEAVNDELISNEKENI